MDYDSDYEDYRDYADLYEEIRRRKEEKRRERRREREEQEQQEREVELERQDRHDRWLNGERSEELEREFNYRPRGYALRGRGGGGFRPQYAPPPNPPVVPNALAPAAPLGGENPSTIRSARRGGRGGGFSVQPVVGPIGRPPPPPPDPKPFQTVVRGAARGGRGGRHTGFRPLLAPVVKHKSGPVDLSAKFDDARFSDFRVLTDSGHFFQVKKTLLAAQSPFFAQLFRSEQAELLVPGVEAAVVRAFLLFLYRGRLADVQPHAIGVLALAVDFEVGDLKHDLAEWLAAHLELADVFRLLRLVERHPEELRGLRAAVFEFARRNAAALAELPAFDAFANESPELLGELFKAVVLPAARFGALAPFRSNYCTCNGPCRFTYS